MAVIHFARPLDDRSRDQDALLAAPMTLAAFVGEHEGGPVQQAVPIGSWLEFVSVFGSSPNSGRAWLADAVRGYFANGGARLIVCNTGAPGGETLEHFSAALRLLEAQPDIALVCAPGRTEPAIQDALLEHCETIRTRFALLDGPQELEHGGLQRRPPCNRCTTNSHRVTKGE